MTPPIPPDELAARLTARLIHDVAARASVLTTGLDLMAVARDDADRTDAAALLKEGLAGLNARLDALRQMFGRGAADETAFELETRARAIFADVRPELDWAVGAPGVAAPIARALTNLAQIASEVLAVGGVARIEAARDGRGARIIAAGPRARLNPESRAGLLGQAPGDGPGGRWVQAYILHAQMASAGGTLNIEEAEGRVVFEARLPDPA